MTPTKHVMIALMLTASLFIIAGDKWSSGVRSVKPVSIPKRRGSIAP